MDGLRKNPLNNQVNHTISPINKARLPHWEHLFLSHTLLYATHTHCLSLKIQKLSLSLSNFTVSIKLLKPHILHLTKKLPTNFFFPNNPSIIVTGSTILNKIAYQMDPAQLQRQVNEVIARGLIRESMSPCDVPALLVPKKDETMRLCVDRIAINMIIIKYWFPISRSDDLLNTWHSKVNLLRSRFKVLKSFLKISVELGGN